MTQFQKLKDNPQARQVEVKYTRMGDKAEVAVADLLTDKPAVATGPVYGEAVTLPLPDGILGPVQAIPLWATYFEGGKQ